MEDGEDILPSFRCLCTACIEHFSFLNSPEKNEEKKVPQKEVTRLRGRIYCLEACFYRFGKSTDECSS